MKSNVRRGGVAAAVAVAGLYAATLSAGSIDIRVTPNVRVQQSSPSPRTTNPRIERALPRTLAPSSARVAQSSGPAQYPTVVLGTANYIAAPGGGVAVVAQDNTASDFYRATLGSNFQIGSPNTLDGAEALPVVYGGAGSDAAALFGGTSTAVVDAAELTRNVRSFRGAEAALDLRDRLAGTQAVDLSGRVRSRFVGVAGPGFGLGVAGPAALPGAAGRRFNGSPIVSTTRGVGSTSSGAEFSTGVADFAGATVGSGVNARTTIAPSIGAGVAGSVSAGSGTRGTTGAATIRGGSLPTGSVRMGGSGGGR